MNPPEAGKPATGTAGEQDRHDRKLKHLSHARPAVCGTRAAENRRERLDRINRIYRMFAQDAGRGAKMNMQVNLPVDFVRLTPAPMTCLMGAPASRDS
jgi:hypothetical protein